MTYFRKSTSSERNGRKHVMTWNFHAKKSMVAAHPPMFAPRAKLKHLGGIFKIHTHSSERKLNPQCDMLKIAIFAVSQGF